MLRDDDPRLAPLLHARGGVLLREDLVAAGLDRRLLDRRAASGAWTRVAPSVAVASRYPTLQQRCLAALEHAGRPSAVTGWAACVLHGLRGVPKSERVQVVVLEPTRVISTPHVQVTRTSLRTPTVQREGLEVVTLPRALRDAAPGLAGLREVRALVLPAVARGTVSADDLVAELHGGPGRGRSMLRRVLGDARAGAASAPEAEFHDLVGTAVRQAGHELVLNPWLVVGGRVLLRPDAWVQALGKGFELDSAAHHGSDKDVTATLQRHERVEDHGVHLRHITPREVRTDPRGVLRRVAAFLATGGAPPPGVELRPHDDPPDWVRARMAAGTWR